MKLQKCLFLVFFGFGILTNAGAWSSFDDLTIIPPNSIWNYNDQGIDLGSIWTISTFNDNNWNAGKGIFGYGMDNISTQLDFGLQEQNKIITYYFRKSFELTSLNSINSLKLSVLRDDGIAVYLNGNLVVRNNLPEEFDYLTLAQESVPAADQQNYIHYSVDAEFLVLGKNTIAVEVHQANAESSDLGFDLYCTLSSDLPRNIVINEVMSGNHSAFIDPQTNQFSDYIELFNASSDVVDLSGYYLSDSKTKHKKWRIPENTVINPDGYILFFADGTDTINHTSFRTSLTGELIGLYDPDGFPVDTIDLPQQYFDISYGRDPNDLGKLQYFANPTAGTENSDGVNLIEQAGRVQFSNEGGFYSGSLQLQLETNSAEGVIRYTTDGGTPRFNSSRYSSTIAIDETTVIKAKVFEPGLLPGETISNTYFINEDISLPVFSISTEDDYLYDNSVGIYLDANVATRKPWERPATLEFFEPDGVRGIVADVDIRLFGRGAINFPEKSLAIYARQSLGVGYINYPLFSHMPLNFFESFLLRSSSDDWRYTLFRDGMIQSIVQDQLNIDVQAYRPSILFLNGEYMGIHNIREKYNENYLASHHGVDPENLDVLFIDNDDSPASIEIISGDVGAYKTLLNFVTTADLSKDENYEMVASLMDIDNYIDYIIVQVISSNRSWRHNRRVWRPKTPDGKFKWLLFDLDYGYSFIDLDVLEQLGENDPLMSHLIENEDFTDRFISRLLVVDQTVFHPDRVIHYIDSLAAQIDGQIDRHLDRWGGTWPGMITSKADWKKKVQVMRDYATNRPSITRNYLEDFFNLAGDIDGVFSIIPENSGRIVEDGIEIDHDQSITKFAKDIPLSFEAVPTPGFKFNGWNSGVSSGTSIVLSKSEWKYLDDGSNQGTAWIGVGFDDNSWSSGNANLGFQNENDTDINSGHITYYFRKEFEVIDLNQYSKLNLDLLRDDGAVVYLNGVEVYRSNMPSGVIDFQTYASTMAGWVDERTYHHTELAIDLLVSGTNTFAVEVHQDVPSSNDLSFDLALSGVTEGKSLENPVTIVTANDFNLAAEFVKVTESQVVISEIAYNPPDNNGGTEAGFIEVSNIGDHSIDISGYAFTVGISYVFPVGTILEAKEKLLVVKNLNNFNTIQGQVFQWTSGNLSTNGETLKINSPNGDIVDEVSYSINAPWPEKGSLNGASVELLNLGDDNNNGNNWRASQGAGGTPTIINSIALANLSINEFLTLPESEGYLKNTDWIEIYNGNDKPIDVGGLYLSDDPLDPLKWMIPFGFPDESTVEPGEVLLFLADNQPDLGFKHCGFKIGGNSGDIVISMGFIDWVTQIDHINYGLQAQGKSNGRFPNG
ncbi:MAG: hypothetical protein HN936_11935, partial [Bacteroidetes bacterium]|nr:hypothetical protein [Bacteroidota bacterium]